MIPHVSLIPLSKDYDGELTIPPFFGMTDHSILGMTNHSYFGIPHAVLTIRIPKGLQTHKHFTSIFGVRNSENGIPQT